MFFNQMGHLMPITYLFPTSHLQFYNLPTYLPTHPPTYMDVPLTFSHMYYVLTYPPTCLPIYLPTYLPTRPLDTPPNSLIGPNVNPKVKIIEGVGVHSFVCNILGVEGPTKTLGWGLG